MVKQSAAPDEATALRRIQSRAGPPPTSKPHRREQQGKQHSKAPQPLHMTPASSSDADDAEHEYEEGEDTDDGDDLVGEVSDDEDERDQLQAAMQHQPPRKPSAAAPSHDDEEEEDDDEDEEEEGGEEEEEALPPRRRPLPRLPPQQAVAASDDSAPDSEPDDGVASDDDDDDNSSDIEEQSFADRTLEQHVADMPFEALERLRSDGSGPAGAVARAAAAAALKRQEKFKRANRHRPSEASSKRPVSRFREVIPAPSRRGRDPRFDAVAGPAVAPAAGGRHGPAISNEDAAFRKRYAFLFEEVLPGEKQQLRDQIKKVRDPVKKAAMQNDIARIEQRLVEDTRKRKQMELEAQFKSKQKSAVLSGKRPFYLKASERKQMELQSKFEELKSKGGLDKYMEKRRRKNAAKDHRFIPRASRREDA